MATMVKLIITSADTNQNVYNTTISNVNPSASDALLSQFGKKLNALSRNYVTAVTKVTTEDITDEEAGTNG